MKTAVSIPDDLFDRCERLALRLGISRSELYQRALAEFLVDHEGPALTDALNALYEQDPDDSRLDPAIEALQGASLLCDRSGEEDW